MILAEFFRAGSRLDGFSVQGHAGYADAGQDIVCASVSSAVQLACNLITEQFQTEAAVSAKSGVVSLRLKQQKNADWDAAVQRVLEGFHIHLACLAEDFPGTIRITFSEV